MEVVTGSEMNAVFFSSFYFVTEQVHSKRFLLSQKKRGDQAKEKILKPKVGRTNGRMDGQRKKGKNCRQYKCEYT